MTELIIFGIIIILAILAYLTESKSRAVSKGSLLIIKIFGYASGLVYWIVIAGIIVLLISACIE